MEEEKKEEKKQHKFMTWLAKKLGPKLDKYRKVEPEIPEIYLPETTDDLIWVLRRVPEDVLSKEDRTKIMSAMTFSTQTVHDIMLPRNEITFVHVNDFMGPLTLDKLYKSGFSHFPVLDVDGGIAGVLHTSSLNSLEIKETDRASSYLDKNVYYMCENYSLIKALAAFLRTNSYFFMVVNTDGKVAGLLTFKMLIAELVGEVPEDSFTHDEDAMMVAKR
ncbi:CBS domain-containing protein [Candidatus Saccharibacteria bacterium]|nr:CBS domain-containing protein [Candidatus Saccharibacteria bacterium]